MLSIAGMFVFSVPRSARDVGLSGWRAAAQPIVSLGGVLDGDVRLQVARFFEIYDK
jgi:hypothetical protein